MLQRSLTFGDVFAVAAGAMISSGLFVLPGVAFAVTGPSVVLAYVVAALLYLPALLAQAELATAMPKAGGGYFSVERSLGTLAGTVAGLATWLAIALKAAFALVGLGALASLVRPDWGSGAVTAVAVGACLFFALVNLFTVEGAGRLQGLLVAGLMAILAWYVAWGMPRVEPARFQPFLTGGWEAFAAVVGMVFVSFGGLNQVVELAEEVVDPRRTIPRAMVGAFVVVTLAYALVVYVTVGVLQPSTLSGSLAPVALAAKETGGLAGEVVIAVAAFLAYATTANAGILAASRSPVAMSRDGLVPAALAVTSSRGTPHVAIALTTAFIVVVMVALSVEDLVKVASTMFLLNFVLACLSVVVMRRSGMEGYRPSVRVPLVPWLPLGAAAVYGFLIFEMGRVPLVTTGFFLGLGALWYAVYVHRRIDRESAVVFLVRRMMSRHLARTGLEDELVALTLERDLVETDRIDDLVRSGLALDLPGPTDARSLFRTLARELAPGVGLEEETLYGLFLQRERESSTVIHPGLAVPHVIVPGSGVFAVALVRCREGIVFSDLHPPVRAVFALLGSEDERNFHLKALVAIAHVVQDHEFDERWAGARNADQLRDVVILTRRHRHAPAGHAP